MLGLGEFPHSKNHMKSSYWSELQGGVEFPIPMNWLECKIALLKMSYWSEILDEMEGSRIPPPSTRMGPTEIPAHQ